MNGRLLAISSLVFAGCSSVPGSLPVAGAAGGAALGALASRNPVVASVGGGVGAALAEYASSAERKAYLRGLDDGYRLGSSDAIKRLYWAKQANERPPSDETGMALLREVVEEADLAALGRSEGSRP